MKNIFPSMPDFWSLSPKEALSQLAVDLNGLNEEQVKRRREVFGTNSLKEKSDISALLLFLYQFKSPVTLLLIGAAVLAVFLGDSSDGFIILVIVCVSSILSYWQERGTSKAIKELLKMVQLNCTVIRSGKVVEWPIESIVPGDVVILNAGDIVPADALLIKSDELFVDEAAFTGETFPVEKNCGVLPAITPLSERSNALFMGSHVISGKATALVIHTAEQTEFGKISVKLQSASPESGFERGVRRFGYMLIELTLLLVVIIFAANVLLHKPVLDSFLFSLALAVGLTPQLLPAIVTVNLATGAKRMAGLQVIVKRLSAIENLGSMDILCADKTGTITSGKVKLQDSLSAEGEHSEKVMQYAWLNASLQQGFHNPSHL